MNKLSQENHIIFTLEKVEHHNTYSVTWTLTLDRTRAKNRAPDLHLLCSTLPHKQLT